MIWWAAALLFQVPQVIDLPAVEKNPYTSAADVDQGKKLFAARCAGCHGPGGDGGKGANLAVPILPHAAGDRGLYRVIRYGLPDTEMPGSPLLTQREIWQTAAFVRTLGRMEGNTRPGDALHGEAVVRGKGGCLQCHAIGLEGGQIGPALTNIGARRGPEYLREKLVEPAKGLPDQYRIVQLKTQAGQSFNGVRLNEDTWSLQIRDMNGNLRSFWKKDIAEMKAEHRSPMPSYKSRLNTNEVNDVVSYLTSLRGVQ
jgi:putative heme-binding domain-containing protein